MWVLDWLEHYHLWLGCGTFKQVEMAPSGIPSSIIEVGAFFGLCIHSLCGPEGDDGMLITPSLPFCGRVRGLCGWTQSQLCRGLCLCHTAPWKTLGFQMFILTWDILGDFWGRASLTSKRFWDKLRRVELRSGQWSRREDVRCLRGSWSTEVFWCPEKKSNLSSLQVLAFIYLLYKVSICSY